MKCSNCGAQLEPNARFCAACGTQQTPLSSSESASASGSDPSLQPAAQPSPTSAPPPAYGSAPAPSPYSSNPTSPSYGASAQPPGYPQFAASPYQSYSAPAPARETGFKNLFSFSGRVGRGEWWGVTLGLLVGYLIAYLLVQSENVIAILIAIALYVVMVWISLATSVKRWHDRNKSGWWILIGFIPLIGGIWALIEQGFLSGTDGPNSYGTPGDGSAFG